MKELKNISEWKRAGYRPKSGEKPLRTESKRFYRIGLVEVKYFSQNQVVPIKKRPEITFDEPLTLDSVLDALWTVNKNVKNIQCKVDYRLKDRVLKKLEPLAERVELHYAEHPGRKYILRRNYVRDEYDFDGMERYEEACATAERDERDRPYHPTGTVYDVFKAYYFSGGYSFHVSLRFNSLKKPQDATLLTDLGERFVSPRKRVKHITRARLILDKFLSEGITAKVALVETPEFSTKNLVAEESTEAVAA